MNFFPKVMWFIGGGARWAMIGRSGREVCVSPSSGMTAVKWEKSSLHLGSAHSDQGASWEVRSYGPEVEQWCQLSLPPARRWLQWHYLRLLHDQVPELELPWIIAVLHTITDLHIDLLPPNTCMGFQSISNKISFLGLYKGSKHKSFLLDRYLLNIDVKGYVFSKADSWAQLKSTESNFLGLGSDICFLDNIPDKIYLH